ncbi:hypothetical protein [Mesorhizobium comanense]|uniref:hypothetical protein n=1 Tax=Mesorhizobium comanense TaxID=2502215 RepID=UPI001E41B987|nr:hypothetical protein [Mesorhizobium comanense]
MLIDCLGIWAQAEIAETPTSDSPVKSDRRDTKKDIQYTFKRWKGRAERLSMPPYRAL